MSVSILGHRSIFQRSSGRRSTVSSCLAALLCAFLAALLVSALQPQQAAALNTGDTFTEKITIGEEEVDCTFMINGTGTVAIGVGGFEGSVRSTYYDDGNPMEAPALPLVSAGGTPDPSYVDAYVADARGDLVIPSTIRHGNVDYTVTEISAGAFYLAKGITSVTIPSSVKTLGQGAFCQCSGMTSINIPNSIKAIPAFCFADCSGLREITGANQVTSIGDGAYWGCTAFHELEIPRNVKTIGDHAFYYCSGLWTVTMHNDVTSVGPYAFANEPALESIDLSTNLSELSENMFFLDYHLTAVEHTSGLTSIGERCFYGCDNLKTFDIPSGMTSIPDYAFEGTGLTSITIPNTSNGQPFAIGDFAFSGCTELTEVNFPTTGTCILGYCSFQNCTGLESVDLSQVSGFDDSNHYLYGSSFSGCSGLRSVTIGSRLTDIPDSCFYGCTALTSITIPSTITKIGRSAFNGCYALNSVTVPASVTTIGSEAFAYCNGMAALVLQGNSVKTLGGIWYPDYAYGFINGISHIYVPDNLVDAYKADEKWARMAEYILPMSSKPSDTRIYALLKTDGTLVECSSSGQEVPNGRTYTVSGNASSDYPKHAITDIKFQSGITEIPLGAFAYCRALKTIELPSTVKDLGQNSFYYCTALESVTGGSGVTDVQYCAFSNCSALKNVSFMSHVEAVGMYAFEGCNLLKSIDLSGIIRSIGDIDIHDPSSWNPNLFSPGIATGCFRDCYNLSQVTLPTGGDYFRISGQAFQGCHSLATLVLPEGIAIESQAFRYSGLSQIEFPEEVTDIGSKAFQDCQQLTQVHVTGVSFGYGGDDFGVPSEAFYGCAALREVVLADDIKAIGHDAFRGCAALSQIDFPASLKTLENYAFGYCSGLLSVDLPDGLYELGGAFTGCEALSEVTIPGSVGFLYGTSTNSGSAGAFSYCTALASVEFGEGFAVTELGGFMFAGCEALGSIDIPDAVLGIGASTFGSCSVLKNVELPDSLSSLYYDCFSYCTCLRQLVIPDSGVLFINDDYTHGGGQFLGCYNLEEIVLPSGTDQISSGMFFDCISLTEITIPASVGTIGFRAFGECTSLETVIFENDCTATEFASEWHQDNAWSDPYLMDPEFYIFGLCDNLSTVVFRDKKPLPDTITFSTNPTFYYTLHYYPTQELAEAKSDELGTLTIKEGTNGLTSTAPAAANIYDGDWMQASTAEPAITANAISDSGWALPTLWKGILFTTHPEGGDSLDGSFTLTSEAGAKKVQGGVVTDIGATIDYAWYECDWSGARLSDTPVGTAATLELSELAPGRHYYYCVASVSDEVAASLGLNRSSDTTPLVCVNVKGARIACNPASIRFRLSLYDNNRGVGIPFRLSNPSQVAVTDLEWRSENGYFSLSSSSYWPQTIYDMDPGQSYSYTLYPRVPEEQLAPGEYEDTLIITSENAAPLRIPVTLVFFDSSTPCLDFAYSSAAGSYIHSDLLDFGTLDADYTIDYEDAHDPFVSECTLYAEGGTLNISSHSNPEHFEVYWENLSLPGQLSPNYSSGLRIAPKEGLEPGVYEDTLTYYYTASGVTNGHLDITLRVTVGNAGGISASPTTLTWESAMEGYSDQPAKTVTITNHEDTDVTLPSNTGSGLQYFTVTGALGLTIPAGESKTIMVAPKLDLQPGEYSETLTLAPAGVGAKTVRLNFTVTEAPKVYVTAMNTTYSEDEGAVWDGYLLNSEPVVLGDKSMLEAIEAALDGWNCIYEATPEGRITSIDGLSNGDAGEGSVWKFYLNNQEVTGDMGEVDLEADDAIKCRYFAAGASAGSCYLDDLVVEDWWTDDIAPLDPDFDSDTFDYEVTLSRGASLMYLMLEPRDPDCPIAVLQDGWFITPDDNTHNYLIGVDDGDQIQIVCGDPDDDTYFEVKTYTLGVSIPDVKFQRLAGPGRYETGQKIAETYDAQGGTVILATGANFPDALCASALAGKEQAPILMTASTSLSPATKATLELIEPDRIIVVGGTGAVSDGVLRAACNAAGIPFDDEHTARYSGANRYATGLSIYQDGGLVGSDTCIIATGGNFADALSISPYAYATQTPIFLTDAKTLLLDDATVAEIADDGFERIIIVGGTGVVSDGVAAQLGVDPNNVVRLAGTNRYETSLKIANWEMGIDPFSHFDPAPGQALGMANVSLATGKNFPDALTGGALCGKNASVLLLVSESYGDYSGALELVRDNAYEVVQGYILGGTGAVSNGLKDKFDQALLG